MIIKTLKPGLLLYL